MARRRRATRVAAAAPKSRIIGGAGTGTPPVEVEVEPPLDVEVEEAELALDAELELVLDEVEVLVAPKLLDEISPLDVEVELPPVEVEVELPPVDEVDETLPLEVELPPVDEVDETLPLDVELDTPLEVETLPLEVETPLEVELEVDPPEVETVIVVLPPVELPPTKLPLKKPAPKPLPKPLPPPITIGTPPLALLATATGGGGGAGTNIGGTIVRVVVTRGAWQATRRTVRRTTRRCLDWARRTVAVRAFAWLTMDGRAGGFSATWTAPPPMIAPPQVQAQSLARAIRTDMISILFLAGPNKGNHQYPCAAWQ